MEKILKTRSIAFSLLALTMALPVVALAEGQQWETFNQEGMQKARAGDLVSARTMFMSAIGKAKRDKVSPLELANVFNNLGFTTLEMGRYNESESSLLQAIELLKIAGKVNSDDGANAQENLGRLYWRKGQFEKAEPLLRGAFAIHKATRVSDPAFLASRMENLGEFNLQQGEYGQAEEIFRKVVEAREEFKLQGTVESLSKLATAYECQKKYVDSQNALKKAIALAQVEKLPAKDMTELQERLKQAEGDKHPDFEIIRPRPGELFKAEPIVVNVAVKDFSLTQPEPMFGAPKSQTVGHIHYLLDDHPPIASHATQLMLEGGPAFLEEGEHTIWVELVNETHGSLKTPVRRKVKFKVLH